jgi:hypothetical protein
MFFLVHTAFDLKNQDRSGLEVVFRLVHYGDEAYYTFSPCDMKFLFTGSGIRRFISRTQRAYCRKFDKQF